MDIENPASPPDPDQRPDFFRFVFFNQRELRPGWRILIASAVFVAIFFIFSMILRPIGSRLHGFAEGVTFAEGLVFLVVVTGTWIMSKIERRNMGAYGLPLRNARVLSRFLRGYVLWGFFSLTLLLLVLRFLHAFYFGNSTLHGAQIFSWAAVWGFFFLLVGLFEEYFLRGYLLYTLADGIGFWPAAVVLAATFAALHARNPGENRIGVLMTASFAMFASAVLRYTGNLWLAVGAHAGWDWGQSYFYGVNDSGAQFPGHLLNPHIQGPVWLNGGSAGPEGSILCLALMAGMFVLVALIYKKHPERNGRFAARSEPGTAA